MKILILGFFLMKINLSKTFLSVISRITARTADGKEILPSKEEPYFFTFGKSEVSGILVACDRNVGYYIMRFLKYFFFQSVNLRYSNNLVASNRNIGYRYITTSVSKYKSF